MSIWVAEINGKVVKSIVDRDVNKFMKRIIALCFFSFPASAVNSGLDYFQQLLACSYRERITEYFHDNYLQKMYYYKICNLDSRISNPDQRLTDDAEKWSTALANLYLSFAKPLLDIFLFSAKLAEGVGWLGTGMLIVWYFMFGLFRKIVSPAFGRLLAIEQKIEGEYRHKHQGILAHSEEIAFYNGDNWEQTRVNGKFEELVSHIKYTLYKKFKMGIFDSMLIKYGAVCVGYTIVGLPVFGPGREEYLKKINYSATQITRDYVKNSSLLINLSKAIGKIMVFTYKGTQDLAGYTTLINELDVVLKDLKHGEFQRTQVAKEVTPDKIETVKGGVKAIKAQQQAMPNKMCNMGDPNSIITADFIKFENIPLISPDGEVMLENMNFEVQPGHHLMISGPNGCGKSSLFRIMGQLWPINSGKLYKPAGHNIFYIPQRPYLPVGTLRDQLIYPDSPAEAKAKGMTDDDLMEILKTVRLEYIPPREGGFGKISEWNDVLSGGEKQRMAIGRLIYHKPTYAILDECTSAVSIDVEGHLYNHMKGKGITMITVSHR